MTALVLAGCDRARPATPPGGRPGGDRTALDPQVVEPVAGQGASRTATQLAQAGEAAPPLHDPAPSMAASDTSAPAKGAPTDAEVRAAMAKFQARGRHVPPGAD